MFRLLWSIVFLALGVYSVPAADDILAKVAGKWQGTYSCGEGGIGATLTFSTTNGEKSAKFEFYALASNPSIQSGSLLYTLKTNNRGRVLEAEPDRWIVQPEGFRAARFRASLSEDGTRLEGYLHRGCGDFTLTRADGSPVPQSGPELARVTPVASANLHTQLVGDWTGSFTCGYGPAGLSITFTPHDVASTGWLYGTVKIFPLPANPEAPEASYTLLAKPFKSGIFSVSVLDWIERPRRFDMPRMAVNVSSDGIHLFGYANDPACGPFTLERVGAAIVAQSAAEPPPAQAEGKSAGNTAGAQSADGSATTAASTEAQPTEAVAVPMDGPLLGSWSGMLKPRGRDFEELRLVLSPPVGVRPGSLYSATFEYYYDDPLPVEVFDEDGKLKLRWPDSPQFAERSYGPMVSRIEVAEGSGPHRRFIEVTTREKPGSAMLRYFDPEEGGFGGDFRQQRSFLDMCDKVVYPLVYAMDQARDTARQLKVDFGGVLGRYDTDPAALLEALRPELMRKLYGIPAAEFTPEQGEILLAGLHDCMLTWANVRPWTWVADLFFDRQVQFGGRGETTPMRITTGFDVWQARLASAEVAESELRIALTGLADELSPEAIDRRLAAQVDKFAQVRPAVVAELLAPAADAKRLAFARRDAAGQAERERAAAARMQGVTVPPTLLTLAYYPLIEQLVAGRLQGFTAASNAYFAGMASELSSRCGLPSSAAERLSLVTFLMAGANQAALGTDFSNADLGATLSSQFSGTANFAAGARTIVDIGCDSAFAPVLAASIVEAVAASKSVEGGREDLFQRTCQLDREPAQCACIAEIGQSVIPGIRQMQYDRNLLAQIIQGNPLVGMQIGITCGVGNY